jgi:hypothetical protein
MAFELKKFTEDSLKSTIASWISSAENLGIPSLEYEVNLAWTENHIEYETDNNLLTCSSLAYGIFESESDEAVAIVDIVYSHRSGPDIGWLKMLSVKLGPTLSPLEVDSDTSKLAQVIDIYAEAIIGTISLTSDHKARVIKLYGRNEKLLTLLVALNERLHILLKDTCHTRMDCRWLVISAH